MGKRPLSQPQNIDDFFDVGGADEVARVAQFKEHLLETGLGENHDLQTITIPGYEGDYTGKETGTQSLWRNLRALLFMNLRLTESYQYDTLKDLEGDCPDCTRLPGVDGDIQHGYTIIKAHFVYQVMASLMYSCQCKQTCREHGGAESFVAGVEKATGEFTTNADGSMAMGINEHKWTCCNPCNDYGSGAQSGPSTGGSASYMKSGTNTRFYYIFGQYSPGKFEEAQAEIKREIWRQVMENEFSTKIVEFAAILDNTDCRVCQGIT